ncbi:MAG: enoyl-CoA hydratase/isomerase family protein [Burkholderiaceae bacterium]|nr:enoyl-CoA hydratase/isomerase family protein [Burkholderiaceae bacterium]
MEKNEDLVVEERAPGVIWITIDRAQKHNALARNVLSGIANAIKAESNRPETRVIVLTGAGDRFFAAGGDLVDLASVRDEEATIAMTNEARMALDTVRNCSVPVLAYLNGDAIGGGAELALACDMRMQASHARIGFIQAKLAITSAWGGGPDLCQLVGAARAMRMMSRCELVDADQALRWGLADAVIGDGLAGADIQAFISPMLNCAPQVLRGIKAQTSAWRQGESYNERRALEQRQLVKTWLHHDHWNAAEKLLAKR